MPELRGAYTALITPFDLSSGHLDLHALERLIGSQAEGGIRGVIPCGTTGEAPSLDHEEYRTFVGRTIEVAHGLGMEVIPGAGSNSTSHAVANNRLVAELGADAALHVAPYYNRPSQEGLYTHFMAIADSADHPIVVYDVPGRSGVRIAPETIIRLAGHPNIRGLKAAGGSIDDVTEVVRGCDLSVLSGDDTLTLPMMSVGARGVISVLSNVMPATVSSLCTAVHEGRWEDARELHHRSHPIARALLELDSNPIPVKTAMELLGLCSGSLRLPLVPPGPEVRATLARMFTDSEVGLAAEAAQA
ncbi:MAG: 4-hydroxy-tetrahydrodipicolinate synthase [Phycisphaerales bacterium]|nr:4-hydroxy-tetrahydrodipicolinate synthase [Phycisphaerales bacterium]